MISLQRACATVRFLHAFPAKVDGVVFCLPALCAPPQSCDGLETCDLYLYNHYAYSHLNITVRHGRAICLVYIARDNTLVVAADTRKYSLYLGLLYRIDIYIDINWT